MIDNQLVPPSAPPPAAWRDVRLKTPAGTIALKLDGTPVHLTVFGNADGPLLGRPQPDRASPFGIEPARRKRLRGGQRGL